MRSGPAIREEETRLLAPVQLHQKLASVADEKRFANFELLVAGAFLAAMFLVNVATAELYPRSWNDEAMWLDPAINLLRHNGMTSSTWYNSTFGQFWYGNTPLYVGVVFVWGKLVGDGFTALRSLNFILISVASLLLYQFARRSSELTTARSRLALVLLPVFGYGVTFAYRSARPDTLCLVLAALLLLATTLQRPSLKYLSVASIGALFPWAGLQLVAYAIVMAGLVVLATGRRYLRTVFCVAAGLVAGGCLMLAFYAAAGYLKEFIIATVGSQRAVSGQLVQYLVLGDARGPARFIASAIFGAVTRDPSSVLGLVAAIILLLLPRVRRSRAATHCLLASVAAGLLIPLGMYFAGLYAVYYTWMALLPIWFFVLAAVDRLGTSARLERIVAYALLAGSLLIGWPFLVGSSALQASTRDYGPVRRLVGQVVKPGEWVCISPETYFAVVERGGVPFLCDGYASSRLAPEIPPEQRQRLSLIVATAPEAATIMDRLPGHWTEIESLDEPRQKTPGFLSWLY